MRPGSPRRVVFGYAAPKRNHRFQVPSEIEERRRCVEAVYYVVFMYQLLSLSPRAVGRVQFVGSLAGFGFCRMSPIWAVSTDSCLNPLSKNMPTHCDCQAG